MKQETQSTCQPNSVVHYLRAHKQMVHIISSTQAAKFVFYEETLKERKQVVEVTTKYTSRTYAVPVETSQGLIVLVYGQPKKLITIVRFTFDRASGLWSEP